MKFTKEHERSNAQRSNGNSILGNLTSQGLEPTAFKMSPFGAGG